MVWCYLFSGVFLYDLYALLSLLDLLYLRPSWIWPFKGYLHRSRFVMATPRISLCCRRSCPSLVNVWEPWRITSARRDVETRRDRTTSDKGEVRGVLRVLWGCVRVCVFFLNGFDFGVFLRLWLWLILVIWFYSVYFSGGLAVFISAFSVFVGPTDLLI